MKRFLMRQPALWLITGVVLGAVVAGRLFPATPLYAVATHGQDNFAACTLQVSDSNNNVEALVFLDSLTGDLKGGVLGTTGKFQYSFETNVVKDLPPEAAKSPKFLMVSGQARLTATAGMARVSPGLIYIIETTTGTCLVYGIPSPPKGASSAFVPITTQKLRSVEVRPGS